MSSRPFSLVAALAALTFTPSLPAAEPRAVSGIYPHLAMFNEEGECGTGAVVPWAERLWVLTYAPHKPTGSTDKLYEITPDLQQIIRPESIGGTPANRMIHRESQQLFMGPYAIGAKGDVRVIPYQTMYGRHTGLSRHLTDPAGKIVFATMEEGIYEVDVKTLAPTVLWTDEQVKGGRHADLPGYHGKGFYSTQGRYVYANNGDHAKEALSNPAVPSGVLAEWDGKADAWTVVRRNQFTEVTGPGGIEGSAPDAPLWSIGWDHRSLILMLLDGGKWSAFRLPKASHSYDGAHGWNTEWPRIREIGEESLLMTMHGSFWKFPRTFSARNTAGIAPRSTYLKVVGDFTRWGDRVVLGCDDTAKSEFLNKHPLKGELGGPGQSQSNLWFLTPAQLDAFGPTLGRGAVWIDEAVPAGQASEPFLLAGFAHRALHLAHAGSEPLKVTLEIDARGTGDWTAAREISVPARGSVWTELRETGEWVRLVPARAAEGVTAMFHYRGEDRRTAQADAIFAGLGADNGVRGVLYARGGGFKTLRFVPQDSQTAYDLGGDLQLRPVDDTAGAAWTAKNAAIPDSLLQEDAASLLYVEPNGRRWRLPRGKTTAGARVCREICTERNLLNAGGIFYEMPAQNAGGLAKIRPVATHDRAIWDYTSFRGLLVMSGVDPAATGEHIVRSDDGKAAVWVGAVDDLWKLGKPRGTGGPWHETAAKAGAPSDPYLCAGFDRKRLTLTTSTAAKVALQADFTGTGAWQEVATFSTEPGKKVEHEFPAAFGAYWLRLVSDADTTATATFTYE